MIHQRQCLPLGFEPGDDLLGVHAELDDLERHASAYRFLLLGHIDHTATALAELLEQFVAANLVAGFFHERNIHSRGSIEVETGGWCFQKILRLLVRLEQGFDLLAQRRVTCAGLVQIGSTLPGGQLQRRIQDGNFGIGWLGHGILDSLSRNA